MGQGTMWELVGPIGEPNHRSTSATGVGRIISFAEHPTDTNILFLGTESGGLFKRVKSLDTALLVDIYDFERIGVAEITVDPSDPNVMYIGTGQGQGTFSSYSNNDLRQASSGVYKTENAGDTWTQVLSWHEMLGVDSRATYKNWLQVAKILVNSGDTDELLVFIRNKKNGYQPPSGNPSYNGWGMLWRSNDGGATWKEIDSDHDTLVCKYFWDAEVHKDNPDVVYASSHLVYKSTDFGLTWTNKTYLLPSFSMSEYDSNYIKLAVVPDGSNDTLDNWLAIFAYLGEKGGDNDMYVSKDALSSTAVRVIEPNDDNSGSDKNLTPLSAYDCVNNLRS